MIADILNNLSPVELDYVYANIFKLVKSKVTETTTNYDNFKEKPCSCTHCKSKTFIKYGFNHGRQKYYCKSCCKLFSSTTKTLFQSSKSSYSIWKTFIGCEINDLTLEQESIAIGKSKTTCFNMRHKLYRAIKEIVFDIKLKGLIEIDSQYTKINLKGSKPENMPRFSKKRGGTSAYSGISHHKICLVTAIDENDNILYRISGLGSESLDKYMKFKDFFEESSTLVSDSKAAIKTFAKEINCKIEQIPVVPNKKRYMTENNHTVSAVNQIHSEFRVLNAKKHGISTRHLQDYLNWLVFKKKIKYSIKAEALVSYTYMNTLNDRNTITTPNICKIEMPINLKDAYGSYHYGCYA